MGSYELYGHYIQPPGKIKAPRASRARRMPCGTAALLSLGLWTLCACATGPRLESPTAPEAPGVTVGESGIQMALFPNAWSAYPGDLWRTFTPVEVRIANGRSDELEIRYEDFLALDEGKQQYRAVPPGEVAQAVSGDPGSAWPTAVRTEVLLAGPWYRPYWRRYWTPYYGYYPGPYGWWYPDPYYYPYAWPRSPALDVLTLALREGRVLPGASVQGFIYFQRATARGSRLTVSWTPRLGSGAPLPTLSTEFQIVR